MKKVINGIEYEQVPEPTEQTRKDHPKCVGCCADEDEKLCLQLSKCASVKMIWKEVKDEQDTSKAI